MSQTVIKLGFLPKDRGDYNNEEKYYKDNIIQYRGSSYIADPVGYNPSTPEISYNQGVPPYITNPHNLNPGWRIFASGNNKFATGENVEELNIDNEPTVNSNSLVKSSGVHNELALGAVYDVSAKNPTAGPNNDGKFESLDYILNPSNVDTLIPTDYRKGGMSIKFVQSSDNKYVQYRYMESDATTVATFTNTANWQGITDELVDGSQDMMTSGGVAKYVRKEDSQEFKYLLLDSENKIIESIDDNDERHKYLNEIIHGDLKVEGQIIGLNQSSTENDEFVSLLLDKDNKIIECIKDGKKEINIPVVFNSDVTFKKSGENTPSTKYVPFVLDGKPVFGTSHQNAWLYTKRFSESCYSKISKLGTTLIRDYASPELKYAINNGATIVGEFKNANVMLQLNTILDSVEKQVNLYNGEFHEGLVLDEEQVAIKIDYWYIFNEPFNTEITPSDYLSKLKAVYELIKKLRPECKVICGGQVFSNSFFSNICSLRDDKGKAFWDYCDIISSHIYTDNSTSYIQEMISLQMYQNSTYDKDEYKHLKDVPVWVTEFGTKPGSMSQIGRANTLIKQALTYLSYGISKVFFFKALSYNMFVSTSTTEDYFGVSKPLYNLPYAGFLKTNGTSLTPDGILDKTFIPNMSYVPSLNLSFVDKSTILSSGIRLSGKGFTLKKVYVYDINNSEVIKVLWEGSQIMNDNYIDIAANKFANSDFAYHIYTEIENLSNNLDNAVITGYDDEESYYSMKILGSLLTNIQSCPSVKDAGKYTMVYWQREDRLYNCALWANYSSFNVAIDGDYNVYDYKGNIINASSITINTNVTFFEGINNINI